MPSNEKTQQKNGVADACPADGVQPVTDVILMATVKQYRAVIPVLLQQPWGLRQTAHELKQILKL